MSTIPDDLKTLYGIAKVTGENISFTPTKLAILIERIGRVEDENAALKAQVERLSAPVSDEEKERFSFSAKMLGAI